MLQEQKNRLKQTKYISFNLLICFFAFSACFIMSCWLLGSCVLDAMLAKCSLSYSLNTSGASLRTALAQVENILSKKYNQSQSDSSSIINYMIAEDFDSEVYDTSLDKFKTYEEYLDSHITKEDMFYLEDIELARQLKEQGYHAKTEILSREHFEAKKRAVEEARLNQNKDKTKALAHTEVSNPKIIQDSPFLSALAKREAQVLNGKLLTIIFIRIESQNCQISGYIDYAHRLKVEDFKVYFEGKKKLQPKPTDLSYYNWSTNLCVSNDSPNFKVDANSGQQGLLFRNKRDRKVINVDPNKKPEDGMARTEIESPEAVQIVLYDYYTRKK